MKRILLLLFLTFTIAVNAQDFKITNFDVDLEVNADGSFDVTETIDVFFTAKKRGIFREIETQYKINNGIVNLGINDIDVEDHKFKINKEKEKVTIKIGDPDIYLSGKQQYKISYVINKGIITYPEHQEFHYDVTGNSWNVIIENVDFTIKLPKSVTLTADDIKVTGGRENQRLEIAELKQIDSRILKGRSLKTLNKNNGITAAIRLPKRYLEVANNEIRYFGQAEESSNNNNSPWYLTLPLALFGYFFSIWRKMRAKGQDHDDGGMRLYPPEGLTSAHIGGFVDQKSNSRDIVSLLPYWASEGYVEMKQIGEEIYLYKMKNIPPEFPEYEHIIFDEIFKENEVSKVSDLQTKFYTTLSKARTLLTEEIEAQDYYNPDYIKMFRSWKIMIFPLLMTVLGVVCMMFFQMILLGIGFFIAGITGLVLPMLKLPLTEKGAKLKSEIDGFKRFLKNPDENKLETVIKDDPTYFDKMFPFAIAFGLEKNFLNKVEPYMHTAPHWYLMENNERNNSFANFRSGFKPEVIQSAFSSTPVNHNSGSASGGSFSSGSGVGGGGGGSW